MKKALLKIKSEPLEAAILTISLLALCISGYYLIPVLATAAANGNPIGIAEWLIKLAIPLMAAGGAVYVVLRLNKATSKGKTVLKLLATVGIWVLFEVVFSLFAEIAAGAVYNMIDGSILTAKITMGFALPLLKLPVYALLFCMAGSVASNGRLFCRYGIKKYIAILAAFLVIHAVTLTCSMLGASLLAGIMQCTLLALLAAAAILLSKKIGEDHNYETKMA